MIIFIGEPPRTHILLDEQNKTIEREREIFKKSLFENENTFDVTIDVVCFSLIQSSCKRFISNIDDDDYDYYYYYKDYYGDDGTKILLIILFLCFRVFVLNRLEPVFSCTQ